MEGETPFDEVIEHVRSVGYHNHRKEDHSDILSDAILADLVDECPALKRDLDEGVVRFWKNIRVPGGRLRLIDLLIGEPKDPGEGDSKPDLSKIRLALEHKSVITAHRNKTNRYDDLRGVLETIHGEKAETVIAATVMIGTATRVLNVPDRVKPFTRDHFEDEVLPRLSTGDSRLWDDLDFAISENRDDDPEKTKEKFEELPTRQAAHTHVMGYDYLLLAPVFIDNVHPPEVDRDNDLGIDVDETYNEFLDALCTAYTARWHT